MKTPFVDEFVYYTTQQSTNAMASRRKCSAT